MNCPACFFPILSSIDLGTTPGGERKLGIICTHCGRAALLVETEIRAAKFNGLDLAAKQNRNS
jgi:hypothetical protein